MAELFDDKAYFSDNDESNSDSDRSLFNKKGYESESSSSSETYAEKSSSEESNISNEDKYKTRFNEYQKFRFLENESDHPSHCNCNYEDEDNSNDELSSVENKQNTRNAFEINTIEEIISRLSKNY